jgi:hypothetical protein
LYDRAVPPKERCNLGRFGVVMGDGVDGVHGGGWTENRDDHKKKVAQSYVGRQTVVAPRFQRSRSASTIREKPRKIAIVFRVAKRGLRNF